MSANANVPIFVNDRLLTHWERAGDRRLVCIQAPGGFGKTTAASWWAGRPGLPVIWMHLARDPACRHVPTFLSVLAAKLAAVHGEEGPADCSLRDCADLCRRTLSAGFCLVLDDYHLVTNPDLDHLVMDLTAALPALTSLIVTSRHALSLPHLTRQLVRGDALLLQEDDLRLGTADIARFLQIADAAADDLYRQTGGWFFALALAQEVRHMAPMAFDEQLASYLSEEILAPLPAGLVAFMQVTALMDSFTVADCLALGLPEAEAALRQLRRDRLFLQDVDGAFSYHALIRQALAERLPVRERLHWHRRMGEHLFAQERQACLPHLLAAKAWPEACRAVAWFHLTQWLENAQEKPTLSHWFQQLSGADLQDDPWYLLLHWLLTWRGMTAAEQEHVLDRIGALFAERQDLAGTAVAVHYRWRHYHRLMAYDACRDWLPAVVSAREALPAAHPAAQMCQDVLIEYYSYLAPDRRAFEAAVNAACALPAVTPYGRQRLLHNRIRAMDRFTTWGEFATALHHLRGTAPVLRSAKATTGYVVGYQAILANHAVFDPVIPPAEATAILAEETALEPQFFAVSVFCRALDAWNAGRWEAAEADLAAVVALEETATHDLWPDIFTMARLRLGRLRQRRGKLTEARRLYEEAERRDRSEYEAGHVRWHLASVAWALGEEAEATAQRQWAEAYARRHGLKFLLAKVLLLRAMVDRQPPSAEVRDLIVRWQYRHALQVHFPEGLAVLDGVVPVSAILPRVQIRTLGGFQVLVDGQEVVWPRSNSQFVLLDLLLHPEGSTAKQLEQRYWAGTGNAGLRTDIFALRRLLEPERRGQESRYITVSGRQYRWTGGPTLAWWDVASFEAACHQALTSRDPHEAAAAAHAALSLYQGPLLPGMDAFAAITGKRAQLHQDYLRLQRLV